MPDAGQSSIETISIDIIILNIILLYTEPVQRGFISSHAILLSGNKMKLVVTWSVSTNQSLVFRSRDQPEPMGGRY